ncbi:MAG: hypothetical protein U1E36_10025 [Rickettsiales bacterium]
MDLKNAKLSDNVEDRRLEHAYEMEVAKSLKDPNSPLVSFIFIGDGTNKGQYHYKVSEDNTLREIVREDGISTVISCPEQNAENNALGFLGLGKREAIAEINVGGEKISVPIQNAIAEEVEMLKKHGIVFSPEDIQSCHANIYGAISERMNTLKGSNR